MGDSHLLYNIGRVPVKMPSLCKCHCYLLLWTIARFPSGLSHTCQPTLPPEAATLYSLNCCENLARVCGENGL